jgi:hypothetical protein
MLHSSAIGGTSWLLLAVTKKSSPRRGDVRRRIRASARDDVLVAEARQGWPPRIAGSFSVTHNRIAALGCRVAIGAQQGLASALSTGEKDTPTWTSNGRWEGFLGFFRQNCTCKDFRNDYDIVQLMFLARRNSTQRMEANGDLFRRGCAPVTGCREVRCVVSVVICRSYIGPSLYDGKAITGTLVGGREVAKKKKAAKKAAKKPAKKAAKKKVAKKKKVARKKKAKK